MAAVGATVSPLWAAKAGGGNRYRLPASKFVVGHRGACAYAPENTLASYRLALSHQVEFVEQDLQITKDKVLVCSHDTSLERVSNVAEIFPDRFQEKEIKGQKIKQWLIHDFTLDEIQQLDAGARFNPKFKGEKIPTFQDAIDLIKGKAGLCPETKGPEYYGRLGFDMEALFIEVLKKNGLNKASVNPKTPILIQSFSKQSLDKLLKTKTGWPMLWLSATKWTPAMLDEAGKKFSALGPSKGEVTPAFVEQAHTHGLKVIPFTFRQSETPKQFAGVKEEMRHFLDDLGVDGMFTDNPDQFPRKS